MYNAFRHKKGIFFSMAPRKWQPSKILLWFFTLPHHFHCHPFHWNSPHHVRQMLEYRRRHHLYLADYHLPISDEMEIRLLNQIDIYIYFDISQKFVGENLFFFVLIQFFQNKSEKWNFHTSTQAV